MSADASCPLGLTASPLTEAPWPTKRTTSVEPSLIVTIASSVRSTSSPGTGDPARLIALASRPSGSATSAAMTPVCPVGHAVPPATNAPS